MASTRELQAALEMLLDVHAQRSASASGAALVPKRSSDSSSSDGDNDDTVAPQQQQQLQQQLQLQVVRAKKRPRQTRKPTYYVRKVRVLAIASTCDASACTQQALAHSHSARTHNDTQEETQALQAELAVLSAQLAFLTSENGILANPHAVAPSLLAQLQDALQRKQAENMVLRDAVRGNALTLARIQSAFSGRTVRCRVLVSVRPCTRVCVC